MSVLDLLKSQLSGDTLTQLASKINVDPQTAQSAISAALPTLLGALATNAAKPDGAAALNSALSQHTEGPLAKIQGASGASLLSEGAKILGHVFGNKQQLATTAVAKSSGLDLAQVGALLAGVAPIVLGALGQKKKEENLDANSLASALAGEGQQAKATGFLSFLDADGDGSIMDDVLEKGGTLLSSGALSGLFGKKG